MYTDKALIEFYNHYAPRSIVLVIALDAVGPSSFPGAALSKALGF